MRYGGFEVMKNKKIKVMMTEQDLHRVVMEGVKHTLQEIGDTHRGQYALGRVMARDRKDPYETSRYNNMVLDRVKRSDLSDDDSDFGKGFNDQRRAEEGSYDMGGKRKLYPYDKMRPIVRNSLVMKDRDNDELRGKFINWMEGDSQALQQVVDYYQGNDSDGRMNTIFAFEDEVLGYDLSDEQRDEIKKELNSWWYYAEGQFTDEEEPQEEE
jgi:hypothetical protein